MAAPKPKRRLHRWPTEPLEHLDGVPDVTVQVCPNCGLSREPRDIVDRGSSAGPSLAYRYWMRDGEMPTMTAPSCVEPE